jgi:PEP-CTERM motif
MPQRSQSISEEKMLVNLLKMGGTAAMLWATCFLGHVQAQVIGDFEGSLEPGWVVTAGSGAPSTNWSSTGSSSLQLTPSGNGFAWALQFNDLATAQKLSSTHLLQFDAHWDSSEWQPDTNADGWLRWDIGSLNSELGGWSQITDANITDPANPSYPGSWDPNNWGSSHTRTLTYDFTTLGYDPTGSSWAQFNLAYNFGNIETIGNLYIDNVRLIAVPEPGSLALLGIAVALLFIRRR